MYILDIYLEKGDKNVKIKRRQNKMITKIKLYIGAENKTHKITKAYEKKIENILAKYWKNFTLIKSRGCYEGQVEDSICAVIIVLQLVFQDLIDCMDELKVELTQEKIGYEITVDVDFRLR